MHIFGVPLPLTNLVLIASRQRRLRDSEASAIPGNLLPGNALPRNQRWEIFATANRAQETFGGKFSPRQILLKKPAEPL